MKNDLWGHLQPQNDLWGHLYPSLAEAVKAIFGENRHVAKKTPISGGDINDAYALTLDDGTILFMKSNTVSSLANFRAEAAGLEAIRATGAIGVPAVLGMGTDKGFSFLLLEYIRGGSRIRNYWEMFAAQLAEMHRADVPSGANAPNRANVPSRADVSNIANAPESEGKEYGFSEDNWIGARKQLNTLHSEWIPFFRDCRLAPQLQSARSYFSGEDLNRAEYILANLDRYLVEPEKPSLVHGDLWSGNMITGDDGKGWLIDPAVYYGHPEVDIAMTELFGGFPRAFYEAYKEAGRLQPGYEDRKDLYNLYQLLNHLNMFGRGYLPEVRWILAKYGKRNTNR